MTHVPGTNKIFAGSNNMIYLFQLNTIFFAQFYNPFNQQVGKITQMRYLSVNFIISSCLKGLHAFYRYSLGHKPSFYYYIARNSHITQFVYQKIDGNM